ncbi:MAG TPA: hypothetical protein VGB91_06540 [Rhizomicrobium sp.]
MRLGLAAFAILAALTVSSCDINTGTPKAAKVECNCAPPLQAAAVPAKPDIDMPRPAHRHRRHRADHYAGGGYHAFAWRREYSEYSVSTYDYRSDSRSYVTGGERYRTAGGRADGYGYGHGGGAAAGIPAHYETGGHGRARMDPWHGYDADCPDEDAPRR